MHSYKNEYFIAGYNNFVLLAFSAAFCHNKNQSGLHRRE